MAVDTHRSLYADDPSMTALLQEYVGRLPQHVQTIRMLTASNQAEELRLQLHQLKGSGLSFGFPHITAHAAAAEESIIAGFPLAAASEHLTALIDYIEHVEGYRPL
jgi:HPt (histidine-containing phosphotransfer) domain-containing protein